MKEFPALTVRVFHSAVGPCLLCTVLGRAVFWRANYQEWGNAFRVANVDQLRDVIAPELEVEELDEALDYWPHPAGAHFGQAEEIASLICLPDDPAAVREMIRSLRACWAATASAVRRALDFPRWAAAEIDEDGKLHPLEWREED